MYKGKFDYYIRLPMLAIVWNLFKKNDIYFDVLFLNELQSDKFTVHFALAEIIYVVSQLSFSGLLSQFPRRGEQFLSLRSL